LKIWSSVFYEKPNQHSSVYTWWPTTILFTPLRLTNAATYSKVNITQVKYNKYIEKRRKQSTQTLIFINYDIHFNHQNENSKQTQSQITHAGELAHHQLPH